MKQMMNHAVLIKKAISLIISMSVMILVIPGLVYAAEELRDEDITKKIEASLTWDDAVSPHLIDVQTTNGIVTLSGSVDNILSRDRAVKICESIKGVRAIVNRIEVRPVDVADKEISKDVENALLLDPVTESHEINVNVKNGKVSVSGTVNSWAEKQIASQVVKGIKGVRTVENDIVVEYAEKRSDQDIKADIKRRLQLDPYIDDGLITVQVENGNVTLNGSIGSLAEKSYAYSDSWVNGVKSVDFDELEVKWWLEDKLKREDKYAEKTDFELQEAIKDALLYDPRTVSFKIDVVVMNRIATLNGVVDNLSAKKAAEKDARNTIGILHVNNYLKVRPEELPTDDKLEMNISNALLRDPIVNRFDISVTVLNKKAYLYGVVDKGYEKIRAESVVSSVPGVVEVSNNITVRPFEWTWKSDEQIKNDIEDEFFWSLLVDGGDIDVSVTEGTAELKGSVDDWGEYYAAVDNAFEGGALNVEAHLKVESAGNKTINGYYKYPVWDFEYPFLIL